MDLRPVDDWPLWFHRALLLVAGPGVSPLRLLIYLNFRGATPLVDLRIFQHLAVSLDGLTYFCLQFINIGLSLVIPIYAQYTLHASALSLEQFFAWDPGGGSDVTVMGP